MDKEPLKPADAAFRSKLFKLAKQLCPYYVSWNSSGVCWNNSDVKVECHGNLLSCEMPVDRIPDVIKKIEKGNNEPRTER